MRTRFAAPPTSANPRSDLVAGRTRKASPAPTPPPPPVRARGGNGWTVLELELQTGEVRTTWSGNLTQTLAAAYPLLVLDMYEHAPQIDLGAAAAKYIDAFFANIHRDEVNRRLGRGVAAAKLLQR